MRRMPLMGSAAVLLLSAACSGQGVDAPVVETSVTSSTLEPITTTLGPTTTTVGPTVTVGSVSTPSVRDRARDAQDLWQSRRPPAYRYLAVKHGQWGPPGVWDILVSGTDELWMGSLSDEDRVSAHSEWDAFDIDVLFGFIIGQADLGTIRAVFDPEWGIPLSVYHDIPDSVDDEWNLHLTWVADRVPGPVELMDEVIGTVDAIFEGTVIETIGDLLVVEVGTVHFAHPGLDPGVFDAPVGAVDIRMPNPINPADDWVGEEIIILGTLNKDVYNLRHKDRQRLGSVWLIRAAGVRTPDGLQAIEGRFFTLARDDLCATSEITTISDADADIEFLADWATLVVSQKDDDPRAQACAATTNGEQGDT